MLLHYQIAVQDYCKPMPPHLIASQEVREVLQASLVLVVVVLEQVLATLDASWANE